MLTTTEEVWLDGSTRSYPAYRVKNPTQAAIVFGNADATRREGTDGRQLGGARGLFLLREQCVYVGKKPNGEKQYRNRYLELTIPPGATVLIAEPVINEIFQFRCVVDEVRFRFARAPQPTSSRASTFCSNEEHPRQLTGGLAPQLILLDDAGDHAVSMISVHPNLTEVAAPPRLNVAEIEARVLARLAAERSVGAA
jgi:hypothetical protein